MLEFHKSDCKFSISDRSNNCYRIYPDITVDAKIEQIGENEGKSMQAGAAMAVVGWWTGYKLGGVVALNTAGIFQKTGIENYWQTTFLILSIVIIVCNIGLLFVNEPQPIDRQESQKITTK